MLAVVAKFKKYTDQLFNQTDDRPDRKREKSLSLRIQKYSQQPGEMLSSLEVLTGHYQVVKDINHRSTGYKKDAILEAFHSEIKKNPEFEALVQMLFTRQVD